MRFRIHEVIRSVARSIVLPLGVEKALAIIRDIPRYPEFLPWCVEAKIVRETDLETVASLEVRAHHLGASMITRNTHPNDRCIAIEQLEGPFKTFEGAWKFDELASECRITFNASFEFNRRYLDFLVLPVMEPACRAVLGCFEQRAREQF